MFRKLLDEGEAGDNVGLLLRGIDKRLRDKMGIEFHVADDPLHAVARGTGIALKNIDKFNFLIR